MKYRSCLNIMTLVIIILIKEDVTYLIINCEDHVGPLLYKDTVFNLMTSDFEFLDVSS